MSSPDPTPLAPRYCSRAFVRSLTTIGLMGIVPVVLLILAVLAILILNGRAHAAGISPESHTQPVWLVALAVCALFSLPSMPAVYFIIVSRAFHNPALDSRQRWVILGTAIFFSAGLVALFLLSRDWLV